MSKPRYYIRGRRLDQWFKAFGTGTTHRLDQAYRYTEQELADNWESWYFGLGNKPRIRQVREGT